MQAVFVHIDVLRLRRKELEHFVFRLPEEHLDELQFLPIWDSVLERNTHVLPLDAVVVGVDLREHSKLCGIKRH